MSRSRVLRILFVPGLGVLFALLFAAQNFYRSAVIGTPTTWEEVLSSAVPRWVLYSFLAPLVGWLVSRFPVEAGRVGSRLLLHGVAGAGFSLLHCTVTALYFAAFRLYPPGETVGGAIGRLLLVYFGIHFVVYLAIAGSYHAFRYLEEVRKRERLAAELRAGLTEARLQALRAQLNPHFLFNTLNATSTLALTGRNDEVVRTLNRLADLLRVSLDRNLPQEIPLGRELDILSAYLDIQKIRFGDKVSVDLKLEPGTENALVPSMVLQPLVENAFDHGVSSRSGPGRVTILASRRQNVLNLRVEDSGFGFTELMESPNGNGIGLSNTRARLDQLYGGNRSALVHGNLPDGGAFVDVVLPFRAADQSP